ncbi:MAG: C40 family peptidase [Candidatus Adiutrix sp.]|jgi:LysM repeat protein|nr:C40 family peptidase [Candidatus Adiutrix sp.]
MGDSSWVAARRWSISLFILPLALAFLAGGCTSAGKSELLSSGTKPPPPAAEAGPDQADGPDDGFAADPLLAGETAAPDGQPAPATAHNVLKTAFSQVGVPYRYGGHKPETGFDCSGFTRWVFGRHGVNLARSSGDQLAHGSSVARKDLRPGDLVFFGRRKRIAHVGIYTGGGKYIHSPSHGKQIQESNLDDRARGEYYAGARRIINNQGANISDAQKLAWAPKKHQHLALAKTTGQSRAQKEAVQAAAAPAKTQATPKPEAVAAAAPAAEKQAAGPGRSPEAKHVAEALEMAALDLGITPAPSAGISPAPEAQAPLAARKSEAGPAAVAAAQPKARKHKVSSGDTLYGLARKYGVSANALARANNMDSKQMALLKLGQTLVVPRK